jgi:hypothetical protein
MQILLSDIADRDWFLLRTTVEVQITFGDRNQLEHIPSNELGQWRLTLSTNQQREESIEIALKLATTLLEYCSLLQSDEYLNRIEIAFQDGLSHKIFFGKRYGALYKEFITRDLFEDSNRDSLNPPELNRPFSPTVHPQLSWHGALGPGYSKEAADQALKNRYENSLRPIQHTIKWLTQQPSFIDAVHLLREQGWLDWHILNAVSSIVVNYRINKEINLRTDPEKWKKRFMELINRPEEENAGPVPISEFSVENLRFHLHISMQSTLKNLGFELHQRTPDLEAISNFLGERYRYWKDDIYHTNYGF